MTASPTPGPTPTPTDSQSADSVRIFVNATPLDARRGETILDAVTRWDSSLGAALRAGERALADNRGIAAPLDAAVYGGAIFRVVSHRQRADDATDSQADGDNDSLTPAE